MHFPAIDPEDEAKQIPVAPGESAPRSCPPEMGQQPRAAQPSEAQPTVWHPVVVNDLPDNSAATSTSRPNRAQDKYWLHALLFALTLVTTSMSGAVLVTNRQWFAWESPPGQTLLQWGDLLKGLPYSLAFLAFLTFHEFGHYFTARWNKVKTSLPYYIPIYIPLSLINIGSFGAVIRLRQTPDSNLKYFDIGIAGPLAGFVVSLGLLWYGFTHLPPLEYLYSMNPTYPEEFGGVPTEEQLLAKYGSGLAVGTSLIFEFFKHYVADPALLPNRFEIIHYPFLFVGYITLFFTALNLLPIGQLDGGHITYGLFGRFGAGIISRIAVTGLIIYGGLGLVVPFTPGWLLNLSLFLLYLFYLSGFLLGKNAPPFIRLCFTFSIIGIQQVIQWWHPMLDFNFLWLFYAFMAVRVIRLDHPAARVELPLNRTRKILGWTALGIFAVCFSPDPLQIVSYGKSRNPKNEKSVFTYEYELNKKAPHGIYFVNSPNKP